MMMTSGPISPPSTMYLDFSKKINDEAYYCSNTRQVTLGRSEEKLVNPALFSTTERKDDHHYEDGKPDHDSKEFEESFISPMSKSIHAMIEQLEANFDRHELILYLQSTFSSDDRSTVPVLVPVHEEFASILAMYCIAGYDNGNSEPIYSQVDKFFFHFFGEKLKGFAAYSRGGDSKDNESIEMMKDSVLLYTLFCDFIIKNIRDRSSRTKTITDGYNDQQIQKFLELQSEVQYIIEKQKGNNNQDVGNIDALFSDDQKQIESLIQNLDIPADTKQELQRLYEEDHESFMSLQPFLFQLNAQQQTCNFIRPLPPLSNFSPCVDLFDHSEDNINGLHSPYTETKDDHDDSNYSQQTHSQEKEEPSNSEDKSSEQYNENDNDMLFFLHPTDPFLRYMFMNTTNHHEGINGNRSIHNSSESYDHGGNGNILTNAEGIQQMDVNEEEEMIRTLKLAFTSSLDVNVEEKITTMFDNAIASQLASNVHNSSSDVSESSMKGMDSNKHQKQHGQNHYPLNIGTSCYDQVVAIILRSGLTPENLPELVKSNHTIAIKCLLTLLLKDNSVNIKTKTKTVPPSMKKELLSALVGMGMCLESMEVVYQLATFSYTPVHYHEQSLNNGKGKKGRKGERDKKRKGMTRKPSSSASGANGEMVEESQFLMSPEYVHMYVSNYISNCENTPDRNRQFKYVRLLSVFLQTLIQKNILQVEVCCTCMT